MRHFLHFLQENAFFFSKAIDFSENWVYNIVYDFLFSRKEEPDLYAPHIFDPHSLVSLIFPNACSIVLIFGVLAFFGYRLFRFLLVVSGAFGFGLLGYTVISPLMTGLLDLSTPSQFILSALLGIVLALAGGLLINRFIRPAVYLFMAGAGFCGFRALLLWIADQVSPLSFLGGSVISFVIAAVLGLLLAWVTLPFFKVIYIAATSIGGLALAGYLLADILTPASALSYVLAALGAIGGVFAMRYQFRVNQNSTTPGDTDDDSDDSIDTTPSDKKKRKQPIQKGASATNKSARSAGKKATRKASENSSEDTSEKPRQKKTRTQKKQASILGKSVKAHKRAQKKVTRAQTRIQKQDDKERRHARKTEAKQKRMEAAQRKAAEKTVQPKVKQKKETKPKKTPKQEK